MFGEQLKALNGQLTTIEERRSAIDAELTGEGKVDLKAIEEELRGLDDQEAEIRGKIELIEKRAKAKQVAAGKVTVTQVEVEVGNENRDKELEMEERAKALKENRAVSSTGLVIPTHSSSTINETFNQVSSIVDLVKFTPVIGGDSYEQAYVKSYAEGDYTNEGETYSEGDVEFGYALINKTKITNYTEVNEEVEKLPAPDYVAKVENGIDVALKSKLAKQIMIGDGTTGKVAGIFSTAATAIESAKDIEVSAIAESTLDEIIYSYGGAENVEGQAWLILNKLDLKAFATLRTGDGKKVYDIKTYGNVGTIDGIPYVINSACKPLSASTTEAGQYCMAYGHIQNYELVQFSEKDMRKSTDFKFKTGQIAFKGNIMMGGNVTAHNGFIRIKKKA